MTERPATHINLERYLDRLDRIAPALEVEREAALPPPEALAILRQLTASIERLPGGASEGIAPLLGQVRGHVEALFPAPGEVTLDEKAHTAHQECLEELFQTLEGVLYACSLSAG